MLLYIKNYDLLLNNIGTVKASTENLCTGLIMKQNIIKEHFLYFYPENLSESKIVSDALSYS